MASNATSFHGYASLHLAICDYIRCLELLLLLLLLWLHEKFIRDRVKKTGNLRHFKVLSGPRGLPVVGSLLSLGQSPHLRLTDMAAKYGSIFHIRLGSWPAVVVSGYDTVREALIQKGDAFASRPDFESYRLYAGGKSLSFKPYSHATKIHRKAISKVLKSVMGTSFTTGIVGQIIHREVSGLIAKWKRLCHLKVTDLDPTPDVTMHVAGLLYSLCFGIDARLSQDEDYCRILLQENPSTELFGLGSSTDFLPWLRWFYKRQMQRKSRLRMAQLVALNSAKIETERTKSQSSSDSSILRSLLDEVESGTTIRTSGLQPDDLLSATIEFLSAGTDTSSTTLHWLLLYMARYPDTQDKLYREISSVVGTDRLPSAHDRPHLPYTESCLLEVMRLTTIVPFGLPHFTTRDVSLAGYLIPKDTLTYVNLWSVSRDERSFVKPNSFMPERFINEESFGHVTIDRPKVRLLMPFGAGRRRCVGEMLGRYQVFVLYASLLQNFKILPKHNCELQNVKFGDILKPLPFRVTLRLREEERM